MKFGEKLRKYRTDKNLTQAELAKLIGVGVNTICNYESGKTYPQNREVYKKLADVLGVDADHLHNEMMISSNPHRESMVIEVKNRLCSLWKKWAVYSPVASCPMMTSTVL